MCKTKPSPHIGAVLLALALLSGSCEQAPEPSTPRAAAQMRPIDQLLAMRMTRVTASTVATQVATLRVPDSHALWRVESLLHQILGPEQAGELEVSVVAQKAIIRGTIPSRWQAEDVREALAELEVLRHADIRWQVKYPHQERPLPPGEGEAEAEVPPDETDETDEE